MNLVQRSLLPCFLPSLLALALGLSVATVEAAPPAADDEIVLTNGGFVRGEIVELVPDSYVVIVTRTGETRRFEWSEVAEVRRGGASDGGPTEPQPEPTPEPTPEPSETEAAPPEGPSPLSPQVHIEVEGAEASSVTLNRVTQRSSYPISGKISGDTVSQVACTAPCDQQIEEPDGEFFLAINGKARTRGFRLPGDHSSYQINFEQIRRPALLWTGVALLPTAVAAALTLAIIPLRHNIRQSSANAMWASAGVIGALGVGGGVTLILFGNKRKFEVLPLDQAGAR